jgi:hypothetical protein
MGMSWWALQGSNLRPSPCEGDALPLCQAPTARFTAFIGLLDLVGSAKPLETLV